MQRRQRVTKWAVLKSSVQVQWAVTRYQARPTEAGRNPSTETCNARRWARTWYCPAPTAVIAILLHTQYNASHYTNSGSSYVKRMSVGGRELGRSHENLSVL